MKLCYLDAFSGISGDMTVGALLNAGADPAALTEALQSLGTGAGFRIEKTSRRGIAATKFYVDTVESKTHRHLHPILDLIAHSGLSARAKKNAGAVFQRLGEAEAKVHGIEIERVHFHEVGAVDSICDIVGAAAAFDLLGIDGIYCSAVNVGAGTVKTEHGLLPVPAPATAELLLGKPIYSRGPNLELTTPTGAAIAVALSSAFGAMPPITLQSAGYGAGDKDFADHANVLRVLVGEASGAGEATTVVVLEANIDDSSPEVLGFAMERLFEEGALDVSFEPIFMKKNRPGVLLRAITRVEDREAIAQAIFEETSTFGIRLYTAERRVKARRIVEVETPHGRVRIKVSETGAFAPEYEDCRTLARSSGRPLQEILAEANIAYRQSSGN